MSILTSLYTFISNGVCEIIGGVRYVLCDIILPVITAINPFIHNRELNSVQMTPLISPLMTPLISSPVSPIIPPIPSNIGRIERNTIVAENREYYYTTPILYSNIVLLYYISLIIFIII